MADDNNTTTNEQVVNEAERQALLAGAKVVDKVVDEEMKQLKAWVTEGPAGVRVFAFFGGLGVVIISLMHWFAGFATFSFINIVFHSVAIIGGIFTVLLEVKESFFTRPLRARIVSIFPFLGGIVGRGFFYILLAAIEFITGSVLPKILAAYMLVIGVTSICVGVYSKGRVSVKGTTDGSDEDFVDENDRDVV